MGAHMQFTPVNVTPCRSQEGQQLLVLAATLGRRGIFQAIVAMDASLADAQDDATGMTVLAAAAAKGHNGIVEDLLNLKRGRIDQGDAAGRTALAHAAAEGRLGAARLLLAAGANVNCRDARKATPLISAAESDRYAIIELLTDVTGVQLEVSIISNFELHIEPMYN